MPEEYRAAPRAPFRSDGSPAGPRPAERMVAQRKGEVRHRTFNPRLCNVTPSIRPALAARAPASSPSLSPPSWHKYFDPRFLQRTRLISAHPPLHLARTGAQSTPRGGANPPSAHTSPRRPRHPVADGILRLASRSAQAWPSSPSGGPRPSPINPPRPASEHPERKEQLLELEDVEPLHASTSNVVENSLENGTIQALRALFLGPPFDLVPACRRGFCDRVDLQFERLAARRLPRHEYGIKWLRRHVPHQARAKPRSTSPHVRKARSTRSTTGRSGPCAFGEPLLVHAQKALEVLLNQTEERRVPSPPRPVDPTGNLHTRRPAGGRATGEKRPSYPRAKSGSGVCIGVTSGQVHSSEFHFPGQVSRWATRRRPTWTRLDARPLLHLDPAGGGPSPCPAPST